MYSSLQLERENSGLVNEDDLEHLCRIVEEKDGGPAWIQMMDRYTSNMSYQAWRRDPEVGFILPTVYCFFLFQQYILGLAILEWYSYILALANLCNSYATYGTNFIIRIAHGFSRLALHNIVPEPSMRI